VYREIGYFVGIEFEAGSRWSKNQFRPQHLLDPRHLVDQSLPLPEKTETSQES
jgi:hypothetical protein